MLKRFLNILLLLLLANNCFAQTLDDEIRFWKLTSVSGEFRLKGSYRDQNSITATINDHQTSTLYSGGLLLRTSSYFWTKKFLILNVDGEYNPEISSDKYLVTPDQAEVRTLKRLGISSLFFEQKPVSLALFAHLDQGYSNREFLTNLKTDHRDYGGLLSLSNRFLPASFSYKEGWSDVIEIPGGRVFHTNQKNFLATVNKSFGSRDKTQLNYSRDYYSSKQLELSRISTTTDNVSLSSNFLIDRMQNYRLNSFLSAMNQTRSQNLKRYQASETFTANLAPKLSLYANYSFYQYTLPQTKSNQHNFNGSLTHKLYESLTTTLFGEYNNTRHTLYQELISKEGINFMYQKKLFANGLLTLGYKYEHRHHKEVGDPVQLQILNEQHSLSDGRIVLLDKAYADISSITVTDLTGSILYQLNFDYILINRNNFIEIQRMPGGQIANNSGVLVTYIANQPGSYQYDLNGQNASASLMFFNHFIELYYRYMKQDYANLEQTEYLTTNYINQNFYGVRIEYKIASAGVEYDDYNSTIIPYKMTHYFMALQGDYRNKILYSIIGNIRNYNMTADSIIQKFDDLSGNVNFMLSMKSQLNLNVAYRIQKGAGIDLSLITSRAEYTTSFRKLFFTVGLDFYQRTYIGEKLNFRGGSIQISRRF